MPTPARCIFLDVDGVIMVPSCYDVDRLEGRPRFKADCLAALRTVVERTGARIVVSSSWRQRSVKATRSLLESRGFELGARIVGVTPRELDKEGRWTRRDEQIRAWLDKHPGVEAWVAIDDDCHDMAGVAHRLVQTDPYAGLTMADAVLAIQFLTTSCEADPQYN